MIWSPYCSVFEKIAKISPQSSACGIGTDIDNTH